MPRQHNAVVNVEILMDFHFHLLKFRFVFKMSLKIKPTYDSYKINNKTIIVCLLQQRVYDEAWCRSIRHGTLIADDIVNQWCLHRSSISLKILLTRKITDHLWPDDRFLLLSFHYNLCAWAIHAFQRYLYITSTMLFQNLWNTKIWFST